MHDHNRMENLGMLIFKTVFDLYSVDKSIPYFRHKISDLKT